MKQGQPTTLGPYIETAIDPLEAEAIKEIAWTSILALEIGAGYGFSTVLIARETPLISIDPFSEYPGSYERTCQAIRDYNVHANVLQLVTTSQHALPFLKAAGIRFDMVFVDGDHSEEAAYHDAKYGWELLNPNGTMICHDYGALPGVTAALNGLFPDGPDDLNLSLWEKKND